MKIAFCGDSFVVDITDLSWPGLLSKEYNAEILCKGTSGLSLFHYIFHYDQRINSHHLVS